jgi:preprotein translocase subunit SecG
MQTALIILMIVFSIIIIGLVYIQSGKVKNVGSAIIGTQDVELFENTKQRGSDKFLHILTIVLIGLFLLFAFLLIFI